MPRTRSWKHKPKQHMSPFWRSVYQTFMRIVDRMEEPCEDAPLTNEVEEALARLFALNYRVRKEKT